MEIVGQNSLSSLNVRTLQFNSSNTEGVHCPTPDGIRLTNIVGYTDTSFSSDYYGATGALPNGVIVNNGMPSYLRTEPGLPRLVSVPTLDDYKEAKGAYLPAGYVPWIITVDNNNSTLTATTGSDPTNGPKVNIGIMPFNPLPLTYMGDEWIGGTDPPGTAFLGDSSIDDALAIISVANAGTMKGVAGTGAPTTAQPQADDLPLIVNVTSDNNLPSLSKKMLSGQLRVNILCMQVSGTTYS